jgi:hypothetical protein
MLHPLSIPTPSYHGRYVHLFYLSLSLFSLCVAIKGSPTYNTWWGSGVGGGANETTEKKQGRLLIPV